MIENNTVVEDTATDTNEDNVDTKAKSSNYDCKDCGITRKLGKDNMRQAGSKWNNKTKDYDTFVQFTYWDLCKYCADRRLKA